MTVEMSDALLCLKKLFLRYMYRWMNLKCLLPWQANYPKNILLGHLKPQLSVFYLQVSLAINMCSKEQLIEWSTDILIITSKCQN